MQRIGEGHVLYDFRYRYIKMISIKYKTLGRMILCGYKIVSKRERKGQE